MFVKLDHRAAGPLKGSKILTCLMVAALSAASAASASCARASSEEQGAPGNSAVAPNQERQLRNEQFQAEAAQLRDDQQKAQAEGKKALEARNKDFEKEGY